MAAVFNTMDHYGIPVIDRERLTLLRDKGSGGYGQVKEGIMSTGHGIEPVAIKIMRTDDDATSSVIATELENLCVARLAQNVVQVYGVCVISLCEIWVITELLEMTLGEWICRLPRTKRQVALRLAEGAYGVANLHDLGMVHCDVKAHNLMLNYYGCTTVIDLGLANRIPRAGEPLPRLGGTPGFMAIEYMRGDGLTEKADVFSFGCMLWELITRELPFSETQSLQAQARLIDHMVPVNGQQAMDACGSPTLRALVRSCLECDPTKRPSMRTVGNILANLLPPEA